MKSRWIPLSLLAFALAACKPQAESPADAPQAPPGATAADGPAPAPDAAAGTTAPDAAKPERPALRLATVDGAEYDLAARRGKWVVVNFWATWCSPCLKEMPELSALDAMREHVEVVGLAYEDIQPAAMRAFLEEHPVVYPVAIVDVYDPPKDFDTPRGLPMTYLVDPEGRVAKRFLGPVTAREIEAAIAAAGGPQAG
jgi:thiol-disulfide isomerase/thioredoxin